MKMKLTPVAMCLLIVLTAAACSKPPSTKSPQGGQYGDPNALNDAPSPGSSVGAAQDPGSTSGSTSTGRRTNRSGSSGSPSSGSSSGGTGVPRINDFGGLGSASRGLFRSEPYTTINVEIDYVSGREPTPAAVSYLVGQIRASTGKRVTVNGGGAIPAQGGNYDGGDLMDMGRLRTTESDAPTASIWVGYVDGGIKGGGAGGIAVAGTVCYVFMDELRGLPFPPTTQLEIEKAVLMQEVFHVFGLVNISYRSPRNHEDPDHSHHSKNPGSVMYWALMDNKALTTFITNGGSPSTKFDADDAADIRDLVAGNL